MSGAAVPVLVGTVPLLYVQSMSMTEGYRIERIAGSSWSQLVAPTSTAAAEQSEGLFWGSSS